MPNSVFFFHFLYTIFLSISRVNKNGNLMFMFYFSDSIFVWKFLTVLIFKIVINSVC